MNKAILTLLTAASFISGCAAVGPDYNGPPATPSIDAGLPSAQQADVVTPEQPPQEWWLLLGDPVLNDLINDAVAANTDLRIATANLRAARSFLVESETGLQPRVDGEAAVERSRDSTATNPNFSNLQ